MVVFNISEQITCATIVVTRKNLKDYTSVQSFCSCKPGWG